MEGVLAGTSVRAPEGRVVEEGRSGLWIGCKFASGGTCFNSDGLPGESGGGTSGVGLGVGGLSGVGCSADVIAAVEGIAQLSQAQPFKGDGSLVRGGCIRWGERVGSWSGGEEEVEG